MNVPVSVGLTDLHCKLSNDRASLQCCMSWSDSNRQAEPCTLPRHKYTYYYVMAVPDSLKNTDRNSVDRLRI